MRQIHMSSIQKLTALTVCVLMATSLTACSRSSKAPQRQSAPLVAIEQSQSVLSPVFQTNISGKTKIKGQPTEKNSSKLFGKKNDNPAKSQNVASFQTAIDSQGYVFASPTGAVVAMDKSGKQQWQVNLKKTLTSGVSAQTDILIVADAQANLIALDRKSSKQRWQTKLTGTVLAPSLIHQNTVISLSNDGVVSGIALQTGKVIWQYSTQIPTLSIRGSASPILIDNKTILISTPDGRIHALNPENGLPAWTRRISSAQGASEIERLTDIDATPVLQNNMLYVITYSGQLVGIDMIAGRKINFFENYAGLASVGVDEQQIYITTLTGEIFALDKFTGKANWKTDALSYRGLSNPIAVNNYLIVGDAMGYLHVFNKETGKPIDRKHTTGKIVKLSQNNEQVIAQNNVGNFSIWQVK